MLGYISINEICGEIFERKLDGCLFFTENFVLTLAKRYDIRRAAASAVTCNAVFYRMKSNNIREVMKGRDVDHAILSTVSSF
jgi:hypothetical protein